MLETILVAVLSSTTVVGILALLLNAYIKRWIDSQFKQREAQLHARLEHHGLASKGVLEGQLGIYPEIAELTYRIRKMALEGSGQDRLSGWDMTLRPLTSELTELLFKHRFFLPEDLFELLHSFKHEAQDVVMVLDRITREEYLFDEESYANAMREISPRVHALDRLYADILERLQSVGKLEQLS